MGKGSRMWLGLDKGWRPLTCFALGEGQVGQGGGGGARLIRGKLMVCSKECCV